MLSLLYLAGLAVVAIALGWSALTEDMEDGEDNG